MRRYKIVIGTQTYVVDVSELSSDSFVVMLDGQRFEVSLAAEEITPDAVSPMLGDGVGAIPGIETPRRDDGAIPGVEMPRRGVSTGGDAPMVETPRQGVSTGDGGAAGVLTAPMPGTVVDIAVRPGEVVTRGRPLLTLEAMKMHNTIRAPRDATVSEVLVVPGQSVGYGEALVRFGEVEP